MEYVAILCIVLALAFDFANGFHDTANAVTTVIYSRAMKASHAIWMSAAFNGLGAMLTGTTVAMVILKLVPASAVSMHLVLAVLIAGTFWNVLTWWLRIPVSSSHCLIGSLVGAAFWAVGSQVITSKAVTDVVFWLAVSPFIGWFIAYSACWIMSRLTRVDAVNGGVTRAIAWTCRLVGFRNVSSESVVANVGNVAQIAAAASLSYSHGSNDGQKTMGVITLILASQFAAYGYTLAHVPFWVVLFCATVIGLGTRFGGERIIKTVGEKLSHRPIDTTSGCAAQLATAAIIFTASMYGKPISTTNVLNPAVVGATQAQHGFASANLRTIGSILVAWAVTMPVCALLSATLYWALSFIM